MPSIVLPLRPLKAPYGAFFIEGDYAGTVSAFANYKGANGFRSANPILLSYFSLWHLGKNAEARGVPSKNNRANFKGRQRTIFCYCTFREG